MSIHLIWPPTGGPIGPGYYWLVENDAAGPFADDDIVRVDLVAGVSPFYRLCQSSSRNQGTYQAHGWISVEQEPVIAGNGNNAGVQAGAAVQVILTWMRGDHTSPLITTALGEWTYDPVGGLGELLSIQFRTASSGGGGATLDDILAAVRKTFQ